MPFRTRATCVAIPRVCALPERSMCPNVDGGRIPSPYAPRSFIVNGPTLRTAAAPSIGNVATSCRRDGCHARGERRPREQRVVDRRVGLRRESGAVLPGRRRSARSSCAVVVRRPVRRSIGCACSTSTRSVECSAETSSREVRSRSVLPRCSTLLRAKRSARRVPCAASSAESGDARNRREVRLHVREAIAVDSGVDRMRPSIVLRERRGRPERVLTNRIVARVLRREIRPGGGVRRDR